MFLAVFYSWFWFRICFCIQLGFTKDGCEYRVCLILWLHSRPWCFGAVCLSRYIRRPCLALAQAGRRPGPPLVWSLFVAWPLVQALHQVRQSTATSVSFTAFSQFGACRLAPHKPCGKDFLTVPRLPPGPPKTSVRSAGPGLCCFVFFTAFSQFGACRLAPHKPCGKDFLTVPRLPPGPPKTSVRSAAPGALLLALYHKKGVGGTRALAHSIIVF